MLRRLFLPLFFFPLLASAQTPTLIQHVSCPNSGSIGSGNFGSQSTAPTYKCPLPELTQANNLLILAFFADNTGSPTWTVSDDKANTWNQAASVTDGSGNIVRIYYAMNVAAGTHMLSVKSSAHTGGFVSVSASEYYNVATTSALDVSNCNATASSTSISAGSMTPTVSGDLLWQWAHAANAGTVSSFAPGTSPGGTWSLNGTDLLYGNAVQAGIYTSATAISPTFTSGTAQAFDSCAVAFKAANAGNPPTSSFRVVHMLHQAVLATSPQTFPMEFPTSGNLLVASFVAGTNQITSISSTPTNTWTATSAAAIKTPDVFSQIYYAANAATSSNMNVTFSRSATGDGTFVMYDILGASPSPFDKGIGEIGFQGSIVSSLTTCSGCITPAGVSNGNELLIGNVGQAWGTATGISSPSGGLFDAATFDGNSVNGPQNVDQNNGWFHLSTTSTSAQTVTWTYNTDGTNAEGDWAGTIAVFKSANSGTQQPVPPSQLKAVVN